MVQRERERTDGVELDVPGGVVDVNGVEGVDGLVGGEEDVFDEEAYNAEFADRVRQAREEAAGLNGVSVGDVVDDGVEDWEGVLEYDEKYSDDEGFFGKLVKFFRFGGSESDGGGADEELREARARGDYGEGEGLSVDDVREFPSIRGMLGLERISAEGDRLIRVDGRRLVVYETTGTDVTLPDVVGFASGLNALNCQVQFLVRQHPPRLFAFRELMRSEREEGLSDRMLAAAESLDAMLGELEEREGIMDRRFYMICNEEDADEVYSAMSRVRIEVGILGGEALRLLVLTSVLGQAPADLPEHDGISFRVGAKAIESSNGLMRKTIELMVFPRNMSAEFLQRIFRMGIPMDLSLQVLPIASQQAMSNLESQRTRMQAAANSQLKRTGQVGSKETIALEDIMRLRDQLMRGNERMFRACLTVTVFGKSEKQLDNYVTLVRSTFTGVLAQVNNLTMVQRGGLRSTMPLCINPMNRWVVVDTTTLALMFPFSPGDLDTRRGTLVAFDTNAKSLVTYDLFDRSMSQNMNVAVLAMSGAGKSFAVKLFILRQMMRGVRVYVIDPEGEYVDTCEAVGGRVLTPGLPGQGMNPFVVTEVGAELTERIRNLCRLVEVMIGQRLDPTVRSGLDNAMTTYYERETAAGGSGTWSGLYGHLASTEPAIARMVRPFFSGSSRFLLSDEGVDLLSEEPLMTVFNLRLLDEDLRAAAGMVCSEVVWTMAARDPRPRMEVVDEVWSIIQTPEGAGFMINTAKRARKHRLGLVSITQDVQDLLTVNSSEGIRGNSGRALLQNASYKYLFRQDPAVVPLIKETFQLTDRQVASMSGFATGEGMLVSPSGLFPIRIEASREEADIIEWTGVG